MLINFIFWFLAVYVFCYGIGGAIGASIYTICKNTISIGTTIDELEARDLKRTKMDVRAAFSTKILLSPVVMISFIVLLLYAVKIVFYTLLPLYVAYFIWHTIFFVYRGLRRKDQDASLDPFRMIQKDSLRENSDFIRSHMNKQIILSIIVVVATILAINVA